MEAKAGEACVLGNWENEVVESTKEAWLPQ